MAATWNKHWGLCLQKHMPKVILGHLQADNMRDTENDSTVPSSDDVSGSNQQSLRWMESMTEGNRKEYLFIPRGIMDSEEEIQR